MADQVETRKVEAGEMPAPDMIISVIEHDVRTGEEAAYEAWLRKIGPIAARFPGYLGINVVKPLAGMSTYTLTLRFDTLDHAQNWFRSDARRTLITEVEPHLAHREHIEMKTGLEFWFTPEIRTRRISIHKQALATFSAIYPLTLIVPAFLTPIADRAPILAHPVIFNVFNAAIIVALMTYLIMPRYTRLLSRWLHS